MTKSLFRLKFFLVILLMSFTHLYGWGNKFTHPAITEQAVTNDNCILDDYLKTQFGWNAGLSHQLYWDFSSDVEKRMARNGKVEPTKIKTMNPYPLSRPILSLYLV